MNILNLQQKIDSVSRFFLYVLIFWLAFSNAVIEVCVVIVFFLWLIKRFLQIPFRDFRSLNVKEKLQALLRSFKPTESFLNLPIIAFLYVCFLSALWSRAPLYSLHGLITKTLEWFVIYFFVLEFFTHKKYIKIALVVFLFSVVSVCADSFIQFYVTGKDIFCNSVSVGRATACFSTANDLGGYLLFSLFLSAGIFFVKNSSRGNRIFGSFIFLFAVWILVITCSRGAWISFFIGIWLFLFLRNKMFSYLLILGFFVIAINFYIILSPNIKQQMRVSSSELSLAVGWRGVLWIDSIKMIKDKPWLGHGPNTFMKVFQKKQYRRRAGGHSEYTPSYAHNCYLQMAAEVGVLGLGCFLWIIVRFFKNTLRIISCRQKMSRNDPWVILLLGLVSGVAAFLAHSFVDTHLYSLRLSILFWIMIGMSVAICNLLSESKNYDIKRT